MRSFVFVVADGSTRGEERGMGVAGVVAGMLFKCVGNARHQAQSWQRAHTPNAIYALRLRIAIPIAICYSVPILSKFQRIQEDICNF